MEKFEFQTNVGLERAKIETLDAKCVAICAGLGFALSILFFMDQVSLILSGAFKLELIFFLGGPEHNRTNRELTNKQHEKRTGSSLGSVRTG